MTVRQTVASSGFSYPGKVVRSDVLALFPFSCPLAKFRLRLLRPCFDVGIHLDLLPGRLPSEKDALIPAAVIKEKSVCISHTNSHKFIMRDVIRDIQRVVDVTTELRTVP
ncbi:hypothetical protein CO665_34710 [Rhizobium anhuiense]|nr:hypothetical protein CO665_34710 [Rhizobium anhuiense]